MKKQRERIRLATITLLIFGFLVVAGGCERNEHNEHNVHNRVSSVADPIVQASEVFEGYSETKTEVIEVKYIVPADTPEGIIREIFGKDAERGIKMLRECENSTLNPEAINWNTNGTFDFGVWQINAVHGYTREQLKDPRFNTKVAYKLFKAAGYSFSPWACAEIAGDRPYWK